MRPWALVLALLFVTAPVSAQEAPQVVFVQEKNPAAAGLFSFIVPGGGQVYNGQVGKGLAFFGAGLVTIALATQDNCTRTYTMDGDLISEDCPESNAGAWAVAFLANTVISIADAVNTAKRLNAEARARVQPTVSRDGRVGLAVSITTR